MPMLTDAGMGLIPANLNLASKSQAVAQPVLPSLEWKTPSPMTPGEEWDQP